MGAARRPPVRSATRTGTLDRVFARGEDRDRIRTRNRRAAVGGTDEARRLGFRLLRNVELMLERPRLDDDRPTVLELALGSRTVRLLDDHHLNVVAGIGDTTRGAVLAPEVRPVVAEAVPADDPEVAGVAQRVV